LPTAPLPPGLDAFVDHLESGAAIILADMGAGSGQVANDWLDAMYEDVSATGARFTAVDVVTPDPARAARNRSTERSAGPMARVSDIPVNSSTI